MSLLPEWASSLQTVVPSACGQLGQPLGTRVQLSATRVDRFLQGSKRLIKILLVLAGVLSQAIPGVAAPPDEATRYADKPLAEALLDLTERGLNLIFTDRIVRPEMRVADEPEGRGLRGILDALLEPHGLEVKESLGERLLIVPSTQLVRSIEGTVREWRTGRPLAGVSVRLVGDDSRSLTLANGSFRILDVPSGEIWLEASLPGYIVQQTAVRIARSLTRVSVDLRPIPQTFEAIDVDASRPGLLGGEISTLRLERSEMATLPSLGEDVLRPMTLLPGTSGNDLSARFHVRGGRSDTVMVQLDQFEILEPFHLQDFEGALSILSPDVIGTAELLTGGFSARYGDRMGGVLNLTSRKPRGSGHLDLGLTTLHLEASSSRALKRNQGHWLASVRLGSLGPVAALVEEEEDPRFTDLFFKIDRSLKPGQSFSGTLLVSLDGLDFTELREEPGQAVSGGEENRDPGTFRFRSSYDHSYGWLNHQAVLDGDFVVESRAGFSRLKRDREGEEIATGGDFVLDSNRIFNVASFAQDWNHRISDRHDLSWGLEVRALDVEYDSFIDRKLTDPLATIGNRAAPGVTRFDRRFNGQQFALYVADQLRLASPLRIDFGLRYDKNTILGDEQLSPRLNLTYLLGSQSQLNIAWGHFYQSQRVYELQVEDGETRFFPSERAEQRIFGFERTFGGGVPTATGKRRPLKLRAEVYERRITDPRPRYENLFDPVSVAPEVEADRVRIAPQSSLATGFEILLSRGFGRNLEGFASYSYARIEDRIDGRDVPRGIDQPQTLKVDLNYRAPRNWRLNLTWELRTGWPTTDLSAQVIEGAGDSREILPILGPLYGSRLAAYSRVDFHIDRRFKLPRGELELFFDVQNFFNARNPRGFDVSFEEQPNGKIEVIKDEKLWARIAPSFGLRWML